MEEAEGKRAADALMEEDEEQGGAGALGAEARRITAAVALEQSMGFELAQVGAQLGKGVIGGREVEAFQDRLMELGAPPAPELGAGVEQDFHEAQHAGVVDFDAGDFVSAGGDGGGQALEEWKV